MGMMMVQRDRAQSAHLRGGEVDLDDQAHLAAAAGPRQELQQVPPL